jgi:hypothetical protein
MYLHHPYLMSTVLKFQLPHIPLFPHSSVSTQLLGFMILTAVSAAVALVTFCLVEHTFLNARKLPLDPDVGSNPS